MSLPSGVFPVNYQQDAAIIRTKLQWSWFGMALVLGVAFPLLAGEYLTNIMVTIFITIISALGLQVLTGLTGQISIAQSAFIAIGAFSSAILVNEANFPIWASIPAAGLIAAVIGVIFGFPALRLKGFYLLMSTLASQFLLMYIITHISITGGYYGIVTRAPEIGSYALNTASDFYYVAFFSLVLMTWYAMVLLKTKYGRAFIAIRDADIAAQIMGINIAFYKLLAFAICCFYAGVAGGLWAHHFKVVLPEQFTLMESVWYLAYILIGGMGSIPGAYFGTIFVRFIVEAELFILTTISETAPRLFELGAHIQTIMLGLLIILFMIFEPRGLAHLWAIIKEWYRAWPMRQSIVK